MSRTRVLLGAGHGPEEELRSSRGFYRLALMVQIYDRHDAIIKT
jgi:hypothetical protein